MTPKRLIPLAGLAVLATGSIGCSHATATMPPATTPTQALATLSTSEVMTIKKVIKARLERSTPCEKVTVSIEDIDVLGPDAPGSRNGIVFTAIESVTKSHPDFLDAPKYVIKGWCVMSTRAVVIREITPIWDD